MGLFNKLFRNKEKENQSASNQELLTEKVVLKKDLLEYIATKLRQNPNFNDFEILKNNTTFVSKDEIGSFRIELNAYLSFDSDRKEASNEIIPYFYRKFTILHDWFKKHSVLSSSDYRNRASILISGKDLNIEDSYHFLVTNENFVKDIDKFIIDLSNAKDLFKTKFKTLKELYNYQALPIIENKNFEFNSNSFDDYFFILKLVHLLSPEDFDELNNRVYNHFKIQFEDEHPHALIYYPKYHEIINDLKK